MCGLTELLDFRCDSGHNYRSELIGAFAHLDKASVPRGNGAILCMRPKLSAINSENFIVPIWMI
jgi:hypothetical protein